MEFKVESKDYSVSEFYDVFATKLPMIVMVNQGFYGDISADTFDRGQILRLHTTSQQSRVIAKAEHQRQVRFYSIPLTYQSHFCVINKNGKPGKEQPLSQIIRDHCLPVHVQFPKNKCLDVGNHTIHTNSLPSLEITQVFSEVYLLGNFIVEGVMTQEVVHVPLYLAQLRLALITGIEGQGVAKWKSYQEELDKNSRNLQFDKEFGNPDIAEYKSADIERITDDSDNVYAKLEPSLYTNLPAIFRVGITGSAGPSRVEEDPNVYETIQPDNSPGKSKVSTFKANLEAVMEKKTGKQTPKRPPPTLPKPANATNTNDPPSIPKRDFKASPPIQHTQERPKPLKGNAPIYMNKISQVNPVVKQKVGETDQGRNRQRKPETHGNYTPSPPPVKDPLPVAKNKPTTKENKTVKVDDLSIEEVCNYLEALKLGKYVETFRENMIDGKLLKELDKDVLKTDFMMNTIESIRLMKFIQEGHVPT